MMSQLVGCELKIAEDSYCIHAPSYDAALEMVKCDRSVRVLGADALALGKKETRIFWDGCQEGNEFVVPALFARDNRAMQQDPLSEGLERAMQILEDSGFPNIAQPIIRSATDFDWTAVMSGENPTYISQMKTQANLFVSAAAVAAQSDKPPSDLLSDTAHSLNYEDELLFRCKTVIADGSINQYQYEGLRWFNDDGTWIRRRMNFVSNVWNIEYLNRPCWMEEVLFAEQIGG